MSDVLNQIKELKDEFKKRLEESEQKLKEACDKGQHNYYNQMLVETADFRMFVNRLNEIIEQAGKENNKTG